VAEGAEIETSPELFLDAKIQRYGVQGVMGRPLSGFEIRCMDYALKVYSYYMEMIGSASFASWSVANPRKSEILMDMMQLRKEWGYD